MRAATETPSRTGVDWRVRLPACANATRRLRPPDLSIRRANRLAPFGPSPQGVPALVTLARRCSGHGVIDRCGCTTRRPVFILTLRLAEPDNCPKSYSRTVPYRRDSLPRRCAAGPRYADLIVLGADYFSVDDHGIKDIHSQLTVVDGRIVHADGRFTRHLP